MNEDKDIRELTRIVQGAPDNPAAHLRLAFALHRAGRLYEAYQSCYQSLRLDPLRSETGLLWRILFPQIHNADQNPEDNSSAIAGVLQSHEPYNGPGDNRYFAVLRVAKDPIKNRIGWIEQHEMGSPQQFYLKIAQDGQIIYQEIVPSYNPYFGVNVGHMHWWEDTLFTIYREKHESILWTLNQRQSQYQKTLFPISDRWVMLGDLLIYENPEIGLLSVFSLPSCRLVTPLPIEFGQLCLGKSLTLRDNEITVLGKPPLDEVNVQESAESVLSTVRPPTLAQTSGTLDAHTFQTDLKHRLFGDAPPQPFADLIIGSLTFPFWIPTQEKQENYGFRNRWNSPHWLCVYWWQYLEANAPTEILPLLQNLKETAQANPAKGWSPEQSADEGRLDLAERHTRRQTSVILESCELGKLPKNQSCYFWSPWSLGQFSQDLHQFPPGFQYVFAQLSAPPPQSLQGR